MNLGGPWLKWPQEKIKLYHGTDEASALAIQRSGIDLDLGRTETDFDRGFYVTTSRSQASDWAIKKAGIRKSPAMVVFEATREEVARLDCLFFVSGSTAAEDFWSLVNHCRGGASGHARPATNWYDIVAGPVATMRPFGPVALPNSDQMSFHTPIALGCLRVVDLLTTGRQ
jgi:hypothetical protein